MTMILKNCKEFAARWKEEIHSRVEKLGGTPTLAIVQVGNVEASNRYIKNKIKDCNEVGISAHHYVYDNDISTEDLVWEVIDLQKHYNGIIVQMPLPPQIDVNKIILAIDPDKDVDGFRESSLFKPCTPGGIMRYLEYCGFELTGKNVVIIGRSNIVGKPLAKMMTDADATVTLCHSKTQGLDCHLRNADLIVTAVGKAKFLNCYSIHVPVVDVGINFDENGKLVGDAFNTEDRDVTPVPGGVGLLTRCMLLENCVQAAERSLPCELEERQCDMRCDNFYGGCRKEN